MTGDELTAMIELNYRATRGGRCVGMFVRQLGIPIRVVESAPLNV